MDKTAGKAVQIAVYGVADLLTYLAPASASVGDEVELSMFRSKRQGWIVTEHSDESLRRELELIQETKRDSELKRRGNQLSLLSGEESEIPTPQLKTIGKSFPAFNANQIALFRWMADYYGFSLYEVLATALPPRAKRAPKVTEGKKDKKSEEKKTDFALTPHQSEIVSKLKTIVAKNDFSCSLLHGVTGSGKTEVYIRLIREVMATGGSALVVVPEIALTPQLLQQFTDGLGYKPAVLHSQLVKTERWGAWSDLLNGKLRLAIGARSAVFAPLKDLRLIIVDEEHDSSYKQSDSLRYNARDVAITRGSIEKCAVVLGSATPSFETLRNAYAGRYNLLELPERVLSRPLPKIELVNLKEVRKREMLSENISPILHAAIAERLEKREQVVVLYNRRGFATYLQCATCDEVISCPNCSVALTYHLSKKKLICHHCGYTDVKPDGCPICTDPRLRRFESSKKDEALPGELRLRGAGTERVVEELESLFPNAKILRLDRDVAIKKGQLLKVLNQMKSGEADILVGTQMVAKGHDIPNVTLVAIIDADVGLHLPDFRSSERTYQLVAQAAGRAGRGNIPGEVFVQTRAPNHPTLVAVASDRFKAFARFEFEFRKKLKYPPHFRLMRVIVSSESARDAEQAAKLVTAKLQEESAQLLALLNLQSANVEKGEEYLEVIGPSPAPFEKLRGRYRFHLIVKSSSAKALSKLACSINSWKREAKESFEFRVTADVDPVDML